MPSRDFLHFTAQKSKCPCLFWEWRSWDFPCVFNVPLPSLFRFFFFFFSLEMWGFLKYPPKMLKPEHVAKKTKPKNPSVSSLGRGKVSRSNSQIRRGHWHLKEFGVLCLNQPVVFVDRCFIFRLYQVPRISNHACCVVSCAQRLWCCRMCCGVGVLDYSFRDICVRLPPSTWRGVTRESTRSTLIGRSRRSSTQHPLAELVLSCAMIGYYCC